MDKVAGSNNDEFYTVEPILNPPFSSVYLTQGILPNRIIFEKIEK